MRCHRRNFGVWKPLWRVKEAVMRIFSIVLSIVVIVISFVLNAGAVEQFSTDVNDQSALEVTVYNSNIGLVKDRRQIKLDKGIQELRFMDVAAQIIPASVNIKSLAGSESFTILEQNYEYDLLSPSKLLDKYVGKELKLYSKSPYTDKEEIVTATLLSNNEGRPVFKIGNEITFNHPGRIIFPQVPENLISKPTLVWLLDSKSTASQKIEALYLTNGITWKADYVLVLNEKDTLSGLSGWVSIDNKSGATYNNTALKLVAGDINRVKETRRMDMAVAAAPMPKAEQQFKEESFFEYHIYTLDRKATVKQNQIKQISLLNAQDIPVKKEFIYSGRDYYFTNKYPDTIQTEKVGVFIELANKKEHNLGMPLPKGTLRVYKHDADGSLQFVGEDQIQHTPKDEKIRVKLGDAFDVVASRKQTSWERIAKNINEVSFEISLRNHKKEDIVVKVVERLSGDWKILESSHDAKKIDVSTFSFDIPVKKDGEVKLAYKARVRY
jgi:hypothetical protein